MTAPWDGTGIDPWLPVRLAHETRLTLAERRLYSSWWGSFSAWLTRVKRGVMAGGRAPDPHAVWAQAPAWDEETQTFVDGPVTDTVGITYDALFGPDYQFDSRPAVTRHLAGVKSRMARTPGEVYDRVASEVARGAGAGESIFTIRDRVGQVLTTTGTDNWRGRAVTVARTETIGALNAGRTDAFQAVAEALGGSSDFEQQWLATLDARVRIDHANAEGQRVPLGTFFTVGGEHLMFPGDPNGSAENTVNCRCTTLLVRRGETVDMSGRTWADWEDEPGDVEPLLPSRGAPSLATIFSDASSYTGHKVPTSQIGRWVDGTYAGLDVKVTRASTLGSYGNPGSDRLRFSGIIKDPATGKSIGTFARTVGRDRDGNLFAQHDLLKISRKHQGAGFQAAFNGNLLDWYRRSDIAYVKVGANIDVGGYTWARAGYDFADDHNALGLFGSLYVRLGRIDGTPLRQLRWLDDRHTVPAYQWDGPVHLPAEAPWTQAQLRKAFRGATDEEIQRQMKIGRDFLDKLAGKTFGRDLPSAYELSQLGRWSGAGKDDVWIGKQIMLGSSWLGVLRL